MSNCSVDISFLGLYLSLSIYFISSKVYLLCSFSPPGPNKSLHAFNFEINLPLILNLRLTYSRRPRSLYSINPHRLLFLLILYLLILSYLYYLVNLTPGLIGFVKYLVCLASGFFFIYSLIFLRCM